MGKRKRGGDEMKIGKDSDRPSFSDNIPCPSGTGTFCKESSAELVELGHKMPGSSNTGHRGSPAKISNSQALLVHHHSNTGRSVFSKRPRHYYGHHYSRRSNSKNTSASTSHNISSSFENKLSFKLATHQKSESTHNTENKEKASNRAERIRPSSFARDAASSDTVKIVCGICQKLLRRKPYSPGDSLSSSSEYAVVAVLVCGHVYHAECLEGRIPVEETREPPCPLCLGLESAADA